MISHSLVVIFHSSVVFFFFQFSCDFSRFGCDFSQFSCDFSQFGCDFSQFGCDFLHRAKYNMSDRIVSDVISQDKSRRNSHDRVYSNFTRFLTTRS